MIRAALSALLDVLAPPICVACEAPLWPDPRDGDALCPRCQAAVPWLGVAGRCALCQSECAVSEVAAAGAERPLCGGCVAEPTPLSSCTAAASHQGIAAAAVHRLKYSDGLLQVGRQEGMAIARLLVAFLARRGGVEAGAVLMPVPLHPKRLRERGFNQSALIARELRRHTGARIDFDGLRRVRDTASQTGLGRADRRANVRGAFECRGGWRAPVRVCLVDDVATTRATLDAAARALWAAGARRVDALCLTRRGLGEGE